MADIGSDGRSMPREVYRLEYMSNRCTVDAVIPSGNGLDSRQDRAARSDRLETL